MLLSRSHEQKVNPISCDLTCALSSVMRLTFSASRCKVQGPRCKEQAPWSSTWYRFFERPWSITDYAVICAGQFKNSVKAAAKPPYASKVGGHGGVVNRGNQLRQSGVNCPVTGTRAWSPRHADCPIGRSYAPTSRAEKSGGAWKSSVGVEGVIFKLSLSRARSPGRTPLSRVLPHRCGTLNGPAVRARSPPTLWGGLRKR